MLLGISYAVRGVIVSVQPVDMGNHSWTNYVQAAYKGVFEYLQSHEPEKMPQKLVGLNLMVSGQVPQGTKGLTSQYADEHQVCASYAAVSLPLG